MPKVLLVEDDNNLREIFEMRLQAEGYDTISASDGEEALGVATKEKPTLIIADVMMPKLSGFEMLETLRSSPEMKDTKVIMMTALGQAEDRARGEKLGVVKYLVKSQVTLEDFVRVVREVLPPDGKQAAAGSAETPNGQEDQSNNKQESEQNMQNDNTNPMMPPAGDQPAGDNPVTGGDSSAAPNSDPMSTAQEQNTVNNQVNDFAASTPADQPAAPAEPAAPADSAAPVMPPADTSSMGSTPAMPPAGDTPVAEPPKPEGDAPTPPPAGV